MDRHEPFNDRRDVQKIGGALVMLFLVSFLAHELFVREVLYDWSQNRKNAEAVQRITPNGGAD